MTSKEKTENEANSKLEKLVNEVIIRRRIEKKNAQQLQLQPEQFTTLCVSPHQSTLYRHSYQVYYIYIHEKTTTIKFKISISL